MGWLDHSTNNIILDAVLTDYGRQRLAATNGNFSITQFALGDDEVDYRIIKKYGRTVGKEKIEKNTPVFEALTNQNIALKYPLVSYQNEGIAITASNLPYLTATTGTSSGIVSLTSTNTSATVSIKQNFRLTTTNNLNQAKLQKLYTVTISDRFFQVLTRNTSNVAVDNPIDAISRASLADPNRLVEYKLTPSNLDSDTFSFTVQAKTIDSSTLSIYGSLTAVNQRTISSIMTIKGDTYGTTIDIPITYTAST